MLEEEGRGGGERSVTDRCTVYHHHLTPSSMRNGQVETFLAQGLVPGDIIMLNIGDRVPADVRLFEVCIVLQSTTRMNSSVAKLYGHVV